MAQETKAVPIERVLKNFERRYSTNGHDVESIYHLARIHSMAYATHSQTIEMAVKSYEPFYIFYGGDRGIPDDLIPATNPQVRAEVVRHLTNAIYYYSQAKQLVDSGKLDATNQWLELPILVGRAWCLEQNKQHSEAITAYRQALQRAWNEEIEPLPSLKEQLNWSWDQVRAMKNPFARPPARGLGVGVCYSEEIIRNLLPLLDPKRDAREITQLQLDQTKINALGRAITPILVSLDVGTPFEQLVNPSSGVPFDLDGSGLKRQWGWITPRAAWLVFDPQEKGAITSGLQMFGSVTFWIFWRDGYDALSSLDDNGDGVLTGDELRGLALWQDVNGDGICDPGEVRPVTDWGVTAIEFKNQNSKNAILFNSKGVRLRDGTTRATYDWIAPSLEKF